MIGVVRRTNRTFWTMDGGASAGCAEEVATAVEHRQLKQTAWDKPADVRGEAWWRSWHRGERHLGYCNMRNENWNNRTWAVGNMADRLRGRRTLTATALAHLQSIMQELADHSLQLIRSGWSARCRSNFKAICLSVSCGSLFSWELERWASSIWGSINTSGSVAGRLPISASVKPLDDFLLDFKTIGLETMQLFLRLQAS